MTNLYNPDIHHRRSIRMKGYDFSRPGFYFVTACVQERECLFDKIVDGKMHVNEYGRIVQNEWIKTAEMRRNVVLGEFVIIPNHFHGILRIVCNRNHVDDRNKGDQQVAPTTKRINTVRGTPGAPVWGISPTLLMSSLFAIYNIMNIYHK